MQKTQAIFSPLLFNSSLMTNPPPPQKKTKQTYDLLNLLFRPKDIKMDNPLKYF